MQNSRKIGRLRDIKDHQDTHAHSSETFFTIVIPTRERQDTLVHTIATALAQDYNRFEVLISDNASLDNTRNVVESIGDPRLRYVRTSTRISMSHNWEFALNHVRDGWVTVLGDDDGLLPGALRLVNKMIGETGARAIRSNGCFYHWPGLGGSCYGRLSRSLRRGYEVRQSSRWLQEVMDGRASYTELPMLYNGGFVSKSLIDTAKRHTGSLFLSMTPDVYSAIVFSMLTEDYVYSYEPLAINGASLHSGGTAIFSGRKTNSKHDPAEKFYSEDNISFHPELPLTRYGRPVRSIPVTVYEAYLQAEAFHRLKNVRTSLSRQVEIAIEQSGPCPLEVIEWAEDFMLMHGMKLCKNNSTFLSHLRNRLMRLSSELYRLIYSVTIRGCDHIPLRNVYEASLIAGYLKEFPPSILFNIFQRVKRVMQGVMCSRR